MTRVQAKKLVLWGALLMVLGALGLSGCDKMDWDRAQKKQTLELYQKYLDRHPHGKFAATAKANMERLFYNQMVKENKPESIKKYLEKYPDGRYEKEAHDMIINLNKQEIAKWTDEKIKSDYVRIETNKGLIKIAFFPELAPENVRSFLALVKSDFYNGLIFHELIAGKYMRGGDPLRNGTGGPGFVTQAEINRLTHHRGAVSMWHTPIHDDTAGSQFYICLGDMPDLDNKYTVIGQVFDSDIALVAIEKVETKDKTSQPPYGPLQDIVMQKVTISEANPGELKLMEAAYALNPDYKSAGQEGKEMEDKTAFDKAASDNTAEAWETFLKNNPGSKLARQAVDNLMKLLEPQVNALTPEQMTKMVARIETSMGPIRFKFYPDVAPGHVKNFIKLAKSHFYDGTIFHRVIDGFMIQGGDPTGTGTGGPGYKIKAEFNSKLHIKGTVSMARSGDPDSAGSQFFICLAPQPSLDNKYTAFGEVIEGQAVVDAIGKVKTIPGDRPIEPVVMKKVTIEGE